ncbi:MAG: DUF4142 domain-containing protein [Bryobacteraceae bacterium]
MKLRVPAGVVVFGGVLLVLAAPAGARRSDAEWIERVDTYNHEMIELSRIVKQRTQSLEMHELAARMITDHGRARRELLDLAPSPPTGGLSASGITTLKRFSRLAGTRLDQEFLRYVVGEYRRGLALYRRISREANNPRLRKHAQEAVPLLEANRRRASELALQAMREK